MFPKFFSFENIILVTIYLLIFIALVYFISLQQKTVKFKSLLIRGYLFKIFIGIGFALTYEFYYNWSGDTIYYFGNACTVGDFLFTNPSAFFKIVFGTINESNIYSLPANLGYFPPITDISKYAAHRFIAPFTIIGLKNYYLTDICLNTFLFIINWKFFRFIQAKFPEKTNILAFSFLFIPSIGFWGGGLTKDAFCFSFTLLFVLCFHKIFINLRFKIIYILLFLFSFYTLKVFKPYILYSLLMSCVVLGATSYLYIIKNQFLRIIALPIIVIVFGIGGLFVLQRTASNVGGAYSSVDSMLEKASVTQMDLKQEYYQGNSFDIGDIEPNIGSALSVMPAAILAGLLRPFIWDVRSLSMLMSGLENLALLILILYTFIVIFKTSISQTINIIRKNPILVFCLFFSLVMALGIGISTSNFGALVRFKIPFFPFWVLFWLFLYDELKRLLKNGSV